MKEMENIHCELRKIVEIQSSTWEGLNTSGGDEFSHPTGSQTDGESETPIGGFLEDVNYAWLGSGPRLVVINIRTGESIASWTFRDKVNCVAQFPTQPGEVSLLLVGLDNGATKVKDSAGMLCIFDCSTSRVLRAIRMPAGVEQVCVINGGAEWEDFNEKRTFEILSNSSGVACVVLRNLYHIILDLRRTLWEGDTSNSSSNELNPTDIEFSQNKKYSSSSRHSDKGKHLAYNLLHTGIEEYIRFNREEFELSSLYNENLTTALIHSKKIGCLISACLGRIIIWQNDGSLGWISAPAKKNMTISHLALLEPTDDPRPFYYLWVGYQEESFETAPVLQMYAMLVEREYCETETNLQFKLEGEPSMKFEMRLEVNERLTNLVSIERTNNYEQNVTNGKKGEESLLLIGITGRMLLFDLDQWYKEQMPRNIRNCQNPNIFLSSYQMKSEALNFAEDAILECAYFPSSLREFPNNGGNSSEELFYPKSLCLDWVELTTNQLRIWMTRGLQWELLREMAIAGPSILIQPSETFHRCLAAGLVPFNTDCSFDCNQNAQREMLLSLCLEQRWASFLLKCAKEWEDGSVSYLFPMFLKWGVQRASSLKMVADQLCIPLFDHSGSAIGETEIKLLRFCSQQLECLSNVVARLPIESNDFVKQQRALRRVATHLGVLLWFYDVGLLPETHEIEEEALPMTFTIQIPYPYDRLAAIYKKKREQISLNAKDCGDSEEQLFIDELMTRECHSLKSQWERESGDITTGGYYPPPSLQSLLRSYLLDCHQNGSDEMENKHQITIYLLMDLVKLLQGSCPDVDQLIKYPSAFKMSPSLIKLTQAFWLLDHGDYQGFLDTLTGQLVSDSDVKDWHHKLVIRTLMRNSEFKLALTYLRVRKPPLSALADQSTSISLSVECGLVQTAFHQRPPSHYRQLLSSFFQACKACGKLNEILHLALDPEEEEAFVKFLEEHKCEETRLLYYLQRCRYTEAGGTQQSNISRGHLKNSQSAPLTMVNAYNATLPAVIKALSSNIGKRNLEAHTEMRYPRPMSHSRSHNKTQGIYEVVMKKARETFLRGDSCQIPFISAPCTSLNQFNRKNYSNCVLFPTLVMRSSAKRSLDQMTEDESEQQNSEDTKRRKLSEENETSDKSALKTLGSNVAFETPLIERKRPMLDRVQRETETPHSILKIRQLVHSSTSPSTLTPRTLEQQNEESLKRLERKSARQIRFSIGQPSNDSSHEERIIGTPNETDKDDASEESQELYYSPNVSGNSQDSNYSVTSIRGPRPRPSLRSSNSTSNESLLESRNVLHKNESKLTLSKHATNDLSALHLRPTDQSSILMTSKLHLQEESVTMEPLQCFASPINRYSMSNESRYTSRILSSDSSFISTPGVISPEVGVAREIKIKQSPSRLRTSNNYSKIDDSIHNFGRQKLSSETTRSTTVTRSILKKTTFTEDVGDSIDDEFVIAEIDDPGLDHEPEVCFTATEQEEKNNIQTSNNTGTPENRKSENTDKTTVTLNIGTDKQIGRDGGKLEHSENAYPSRNQRESESDDGEVNQQGEIDENMDDSEPELRGLKDYQEDENEECFHSLRNSAASVIEIQDSGMVINTLRDLDSKATHAELPALSMRSVAEYSNITEDESSNDVIDEIQMKKSQTSSENRKFFTNSITGDQLLASSTQIVEVNESNFTEDESVDSSIENFELIADVSEPEEDINEDLLRKNDNKNLAPIGRKTQSPSKNDQMTQVSASSSQAIAADDENSESASTSVVQNLDICESVETETNSSKSTGQLSGKHSPQNRHYDERQTSENSIRQESKSSTPVRMTRARRATSATKELFDPTAATLNLKTSNTVATELESSSLQSVDGDHTITSDSTNQSNTVKPKRSSKRPASVDKEILSSSVKAGDVTSNKAEVPLRRSSRRAASVQKEMSTIAEISHENVKLPSISETDLTIESKSTNKKSQRSRTASITGEDSSASLPARSRRSTSVAKESAAEAQPTNKIMTRKRGNSVPKELSETPKMKRAHSVVKDIINEQTTKSPVGTRKAISSILMQSSEEAALNSPAKNTRSRRLSVQSIPEEDESVLITQVRDRSSSNASESVKVSTRGKARERRAASLEPSKSEVKRKTRSALTKSVVTEETISEEFTEDFSERKSKSAKKTTSRKRTESTTSNADENNPEEPRDGRKTARSKSEDSDVFLFSPPELTSDPPNSEQNVEKVGPYVFSPPHTRSRQPVLSMEMKHFVSPLVGAEVSNPPSRKGSKKVVEAASSDTKLFASRRVFVHPKRTRKPSA